MWFGVFLYRDLSIAGGELKEKALAFPCKKFPEITPSLEEKN